MMRKLLTLTLAMIALVAFTGSEGWAKPQIIATQITAQCPGPTVTITLDKTTAGAGAWPNGMGLYLHFDPPSVGQPWGTAGNPGKFSTTSGSHQLQITDTSASQGGSASAMYTFNAPKCGVSPKPTVPPSTKYTDPLAK